MHYRSKKTPEFLNQCSDFHLGRHFFGLVGGFIVGIFVTLPHEIVQIIRILSNMKTMKLWRKVLLQALFYFCSFMAIIWLLNMVFSDGIDDWKGEIIKGSLYTVTIIIFNNWKEIKEHIWKL